MSGLDYSTFSISSALIPSHPPTRSYPADPIHQHVAEDVIDSHICNLQRDDLPSSMELTDRPRESASILSGPYQGQGPCSQAFSPARPLLRNDSADDIQGNMLCAQFGDIHFTPQYGGHGHATVDEPTAIMENASWSSSHSLHYPTPICGFVSQYSKGAGLAIPEDARPGLTMAHSDVTVVRVPARRPSMVSDRQQLRHYDFGLVTPSPLPSLAMDVTTFLPGGLITSPSPPPTAYPDDDFPVECARAFPYEHLAVHDSASRYPPVCAFQDVSLDHRYASQLATPFLPGHPSSQSPHDHPLYACVHVDRPGSAPPLIDNQVPFVGDARAVLQQPSSQQQQQQQHPHEETACDGWQQQQQHAYPLTLAQSPRSSSSRRTGSIGHNAAQKTRHLRRWSSVTNPALLRSPLPNNGFACRSNAAAVVVVDGSSSSSCGTFPSADSEDEYTMHVAAGAVVDVPEAPLPSTSASDRTVVRCDDHLVDEDSWSAAFARPDKQLHVYECFWDAVHSPCGMWIEGDQSSVADHLALFHNFRGGEVTTRCLWRDCPKPHMKGTSIARHVVTHVGFRFKCDTCKHEFARVDACNRAHSRSRCVGVGQPMYGDLQRVLDARKVDPLWRPSKKRRTDE